MGITTTKYITLDLYQNRYVATRIAQYDIDSRELIVTITDNGKPYMVNKNNVAVNIKYLKSDKKKVINECEILGDGTVKILITDQMAISAGRNEAELMIIDVSSKKVIHTMHFYINVEKSVFSDDSISSENEFIALENALLSIEESVKKAELALQKAELASSEISSKSEPTTQKSGDFWLLPY